MYSLKVPLEVLVESTSRVGRSGRVSFYFDRGKLVKMSALVSISFSNSRARTVARDGDVMNALYWNRAIHV